MLIDRFIELHDIIFRKDTDNYIILISKHNRHHHQLRVFHPSTEKMLHVTWTNKEWPDWDKWVTKQLDAVILRREEVARKIERSLNLEKQDLINFREVADENHNTR